MSPFADFDPLIQKWFEQQVGKPTDIQCRSWPKIAKGSNILITAPTGSGKTLTAFLWAINQLITSKWESGVTQVLYISPLKALNNDIQRNLVEPLKSLEEIFEQYNRVFPIIRVGTRSGDTAQSERRKMLRHPPEILITTPESINLLLSTDSGNLIFNHLKTVILDEIHGVINSKRGTHLITAIERLVPLAGEFQRIALSATVKPMKKVAEFVGGYQLNGVASAPSYTQRKVETIQSESSKQYKISVSFPENAEEMKSKETFWKPLISEFKERIANNRSTLLFANSRRMTEKITLKINLGEGYPIAYAHHGSLSREIRLEVEKSLKEGVLKAIVATNSLEMGIDIGSLDEVILIQSPPSISSAIQRVGRSGHSVGEASKGTIFPTHTMDILHAGILAKGILDQDIEEVNPIDCPLDILAQLIISMSSVQTWKIEELFAQIKTAFPYRNLSIDQFNLVIQMLAGRYANTPIRELKAKISLDQIDQTVSAKKGAKMALFMAGGTIPNRGYYQLRHSDSSSLIGELDEEFVWEAKIGQTFMLGTQNWKIQRISHNDVLVLPAPPKALATPFWKSDERSRDFHFSQKISLFLEEANERLGDENFEKELEEIYRLDSTSRTKLTSYLNKQKETTNRNLPHRHHILFEFIQSGPGGTPGNQLVIHTLWGGILNRPYAMALDAAWEERYSSRLEIFASDDCIVVVLVNDISPEEILSLVSPSNIEQLLRKRLEGSGFFGARFRESAGRALLITKRRFNERLPLWMTRLQSQKLLNSVLQYSDFPILLETWRTCLKDEFDLENLKLVLTEIEMGKIQWTSTFTSQPSPMAREVAFDQVSKYMYMSDAPEGNKISDLQDSLIQEIVHSPHLRPKLSFELNHRFEEKRQRVSPGYSPQDAIDFLDWIKERIIIPEDEWIALIQAMERDQEKPVESILNKIEEKVVILIYENNRLFFVALERLSEILALFFESDPNQLQIKLLHSIEELPSSSIPSLEETNGWFPLETESQEITITNLFAQWIQFYGIQSPANILKKLPISKGALTSILKELQGEEELVFGDLLEGVSTEQFCDKENYEILLRIHRREAIPLFEPLEASKLPYFLARFQKLTKPINEIEQLYSCIEQLSGYDAKAELWESEIFPARMPEYSTSWLDSVIQEGDLNWLGRDKQKITFHFKGDEELLQNENLATSEEGKEKSLKGNEDHLFPDSSAFYDFATLVTLSKQKTTELASRLWEAVWKGRAGNNTFMVIRKGIENNFTGTELPKASSSSGSRRQSRGKRSSFTQWRNSQPFVGVWFEIRPPELDSNPIDQLERNKERVRVLLERYGVLFRELLVSEPISFQWSRIFRTLRIMELSGEILGGHFFKNIPGPQFVSHQAFHSLQQSMEENRVFWFNAKDPCSLCGSRLDAFKGSLPSRLSGTHLVYSGDKLVMISQKGGKELTFLVPPEDEKIQEYFGPLHHLLNRSFQPLRQIQIERINDEKAPKSAYANLLKISFDCIIDPKKITLYRKL